MPPCDRNPRPLVPVRVRRRIVPIRPNEAAISAVVEIAETPRSASPRRVVEIESRARYTARTTSDIEKLKRGLSPLCDGLRRRPFTPLLTRTGKPRPPAPARVRRRIVPTRPNEAAMSAAVENAETPRSASPRRVVEIESRFVERRGARSRRSCGFRHNHSVVPDLQVFNILPT